MLWSTQDFSKKDHRFVRVNIAYDHASKVKWSPDSKYTFVQARAFVICRAIGNDLEVYKVSKKPDGSFGNVQSSTVFPSKHSSDIVGMEIAATGKFILTCSSSSDLLIWSLKGEVLTSLNTHQVATYYATISPCARFVASSGFTSDVKVWQVVFGKTGEFKEVNRAFELKGHSAGVDSFAFNDDSSRMATVSKDSTWKLWDTKIEFENGQEPYLLLTVQCHLSGPAMIALSPDSRTVAVASGSLVGVYSAIKGSEEKSIDNESPISCVAFDPSSRYVLVGVDRHIRIFNNAVGYRVAIVELEERKKTANTKSLRERIQQQIVEARSALEALQEK